jgi:uncharacterized membrane protein
MPFEFAADPAWPWSLPRIGLPLLAVVAVLLAALTIATYRGAAPRRRVAAVIALRLLALLLAVLTLVRPALAFREDLRVPSVLVIAADGSASMATADEVDAKSRWFTLQRILERSQPALDRLRSEHNVTVQLHRFAEDVSDYDPAAKPDGPRTDFGRMLHTLAERYGAERSLRGLIVLSDGADNGTRFPALGEAAKWRALGGPVQPFALGQPNTSAAQRDIAITSITPEPSPVPVKAKLTVRGTLDAPGFEGARQVRVRLLLDDKEVNTKEVELPKTTGNEVQLTTDAPSNPGEVKLTLRVDPLPGEATTVNNEISTFLTVTKEGVSVLYVDRLREEAKFIRYALAGDPRFRLTEAIRQTDDPPAAGEADFLQLDRQAYDVIILGDVSMRRLGADRVAKIAELVRDKGVGLLMTGGEESLGGDWQGTRIADALPVRLGTIRQVEGQVQMLPTDEGLRHFVLRLASGPDRKDNEAVWQRLPRLDGYTKLDQPKPGAVVLAQTASDKAPLMVAQNYGKGRTMALAVDTTWLWTGLGFPNSTEGSEKHAQFWKQLVIYLAQQENQGGSVWVRPDARRLPAGSQFGFTVGLRGKSGLDLPEGEFDVHVEGPGGVKEPTPVTRERDGSRGTFWKTDKPGEYRIVVNGRGKDTDGASITGEASARVLIYQDDTETLRQAADHDFLTKLAAAGGGKFHRADELPRFLESLATQSPAAGRQKAVYWPDWRSAQTTGFLPALFVAFVAVLGFEWGLRRYWGMV